MFPSFCRAVFWCRFRSIVSMTPTIKHREHHLVTFLDRCSIDTNVNNLENNRKRGLSCEVVFKGQIKQKYVQHHYFPPRMTRHTCIQSTKRVVSASHRRETTVLSWGSGHTSWRVIIDLSSYQFVSITLLKVKGRRKRKVETRQIRTYQLASARHLQTTAHPRQ